MATGYEDIREQGGNQKDYEKQIAATLERKAAAKRQMTLAQFIREQSQKNG